MDVTDSDGLTNDLVMLKNESKSLADADDSSADNDVDCSKFSCKFCKSTFTKLSNCKRHERNCNANPERAPAQFMCPNCEHPFNRKGNLNGHLKTCSNDAPKVPKNNGTPCLIKNCEARFFHKTQLIHHLSSAHLDQVTIKPTVSIAFTSWEEFMTWKEKEEESTFSYFSRRNGAPSLKTKHFYCQHDGGKMNVQRKSSRANRKGRIKVGDYCIAQMKVKVDGNKVSLEYYPTHSHPCKREDMLHHPLPVAMNKFINEKLDENIPPAMVYDLVKERFLPEKNQDTRASNLTKRRILQRARNRHKRKTQGNGICPVVSHAGDNDDKDVGDEEFYTYETLETADLNIEYEESSCDLDETSADDKQQSIILERLRRNLSFLQQFISTAQENNVPEHIIMHIDTVLSNLVLDIKSAVPGPIEYDIPCDI